MVKINTVIEEKEINTERQGIRLAMYYKALQEYMRVRDPDKETLAELVIRAKGPKRSMRQFAADIGVNPSTLSRITNMQTASANKDSLIAGIAAHADKDSGVTFEMLMEAHGMEKQGRMRSQEAYNRFEQKCRMVIQDELLKRGYSISNLQMADPVAPFDISLKTDAVNHGDGIWAFEFRMFSPDPRISGIPTGMGMTQRCMDAIMRMFYIGNTKVDKVSLVVQYREIFEQLKQRYSDLCITDEISFILIAGNRVIEEYVIPMRNREVKETFFKLEDTPKDIDWVINIEENNG